MNSVNILLQKLKYYTFINGNPKVVNNVYVFLSAIDGFLRHKSYFIR